jgi:hypothetical protein
VTGLKSLAPIVASQELVPNAFGRRGQRSTPSRRLTPSFSDFRGLKLVGQRPNGPAADVGMHERQNASIESEVQRAAKIDHLISSSRVLQGHGGVFKGFTVLIVEDDIDAREVIEYWLQSQGVTVDAAVQCTRRSPSSLCTLRT